MISLNWSAYKSKSQGMNSIYLIFLFLNALVFTLLFTMVFGNRGPWNNPMFFFLVLFLTSWTIVLWTGQNIFVNDKLAYLYGSGITAIVALLLAASETPPLEPVGGVPSKTRIRKYQLITKSVGRAFMVRPNVFFWILLAIESCMILVAYFLQYQQNHGL